MPSANSCSNALQLVCQYSQRPLSHNPPSEDMPHHDRHFYTPWFRTGSLLMRLRVSVRIHVGLGAEWNLVVRANAVSYLVEQRLAGEEEKDVESVTFGREGGSVGELGNGGAVARRGNTGDGGGAGH